MNSNYEYRLREAAKFVKDRFRLDGYEPFMIALNGSQNYNLDVHDEEFDSDYDYYCVVIPNLRCLISHQFLSAQISYQGGHINVKDIRQFAIVLAKRNPSAIEVLLTPYKLALWGPHYVDLMTEAIKDDIKAYPQKLISAAMGTYESRSKKIYTPTEMTQSIIDKDGYYGKAAYQAYRMYCILCDIYEGKDFRLIHEPIDQQVMMKMKTQKYSFHTVRTLMNAVDSHLKGAVLLALEAKYPASEDDVGFEVKRLAYEIIYEYCRE